MNLDDKLREIFYTHEPAIANADLLADDILPKIKQVFADEPTYAAKAALRSRDKFSMPEIYMTGQEWYERFVKEVAIQDVFDDHYEPEYLKAARRAAGVKK